MCVHSILSIQTKAREELLPRLTIKLKLSKWQMVSTTDLLKV